MDLTLTDFVLFMLCGSCVLVLLATLISRFLHARAENRALSQRVVCRLCLHVFENHSHAAVIHCPACGAANERGRNRRLG